MELRKPSFIAQTLRKHSLTTWHSSKSIKISFWPGGGGKCINQCDKGRSKDSQRPQRAQGKEWLFLTGNIGKGNFEDMAFKLSLEKLLWLRSEARSFQVKEKSKCC